MPSGPTGIWTKPLLFDLSRFSGRDCATLLMEDSQFAFDCVTCWLLEAPTKPA